MPAEIGILLVHGIGTQTRGETLVNLGEPLFQKLRDWAESENPNRDLVFNRRGDDSDRLHGKVQLIDAFVAPLVNEPVQQQEPAHVRFTISPAADGVPVEWVMAECHWATSFPPPPARTVTLWIMRVLPWICISFVVRRLRMAGGKFFSSMTSVPRRWFDAAGVLGRILMLMFAVPFISPLVVLLELCLIALLIVGLVPLKTVQTVVQRVNTVLSAVLGDSFIFASSELRQQAIITKLSRDLAWLQSKFDCKHVVVVAHSQGAALAYLTLKAACPKNARLLITFGAGILKLLQLDYRQLGSIVYWFAGNFVLMAGVLTLTVIAEWMDLITLTLVETLVLKWMHTLLAAVFTLFAAIAAWQEDTRSIRLQAQEFARQSLTWIDFYASKDPVPNGPIFLKPCSSLKSVELCNQSSVIADHTTYAKNTDEFLLQVVEAIIRYSGTQLNFKPVVPTAVELAKRFRRIRITSENLSKTLLFLAFLAFIFNHEAVEAVGWWLRQWIDAGCDRVGVPLCWQVSPRTTGLGTALFGFVFLRMCIQTSQVIGFGMTDWRSTFPTSSLLFAPMFACLPLSFATSLYYTQTYAWVEWLFRHVPKDTLFWEIPGYTPLRLFQTVIFGLAASLAFVSYDQLRLARLYGLTRAVKEASAPKDTPNAPDGTASPNHKLNT